MGSLLTDLYFNQIITDPSNFNQRITLLDFADNPNKTSISLTREETTKRFTDAIIKISKRNVDGLLDLAELIFQNHIQTEELCKELIVLLSDISYGLWAREKNIPQADALTKKLYTAIAHIDAQNAPLMINKLLTHLHLLVTHNPKLTPILLENMKKFSAVHPHFNTTQMPSVAESFKAVPLLKSIFFSQNISTPEPVDYAWATITYIAQDFIREQKELPLFFQKFSSGDDAGAEQFLNNYISFKSLSFLSIQDLYNFEAINNTYQCHITRQLPCSENDKKIMLAFIKTFKCETDNDALATARIMIVRGIVKLLEVPIQKDKQKEKEKPKNKHVQKPEIVLQEPVDLHREILYKIVGFLINNRHDDITLAHWILNLNPSLKGVPMFNTTPSLKEVNIFWTQNEPNLNDPTLKFITHPDFYTTEIKNFLKQAAHELESIKSSDEWIKLKKIDLFKLFLKNSEVSYKQKANHSSSSSSSTYIPNSSKPKEKREVVDHAQLRAQEFQKVQEEKKCALEAEKQKQEAEKRLKQQKDDEERKRLQQEALDKKVKEATKLKQPTRSSSSSSSSSYSSSSSSSNSSSSSSSSSGKPCTFSNNKFIDINTSENVKIAEIQYTPRVWEDDNGRPYSWTTNGLLN